MLQELKVALLKFTKNVLYKRHNIRCIRANYGRPSSYDKENGLKIIYDSHDIFIEAYKDRIT
jgi:hypothetical protein